MVTTPITKRICIALSLAFLAALTPPLRIAVLDWIGMDDLLAPHMAAGVSQPSLSWP
jgi:hypothetical protein